MVHIIDYFCSQSSCRDEQVLASWLLGKNLRSCREMHTTYGEQEREAKKRSARSNTIVDRPGYLHVAWFRPTRTTENPSDFSSFIQLVMRMKLISLFVKPSSCYLRSERATPPDVRSQPSCSYVHPKQDPPSSVE
jgi:hypothetical protein